MSRRRVRPLVVACMLALAAVPARTQPGRDGWARFDEPSALSAASAIAASEAPGDAAVLPLAMDDGLLTVQGVFRLDKGSRWSTLGAEIAPTGAQPGADMSGASVLRIRLASADTRPLRLRIKGGDRDIAGAGCYPVVLQRVTPVAADYVIPLSAFRSPGWCGAKAVGIEQTLHAVERVEVTANDGPAGPVRFSIGRIDFLPDDWDARQGPWHLAWQDDFDGERDHAPAATRWRADAAAGGELAFDGAGHLRLRPRPAGGRVSMRSAPDRPIMPGRVEVRLRVPEAAPDGRAARIRIALQAPAPGAAAIVLLEGDAGAGGFASGLDIPGAPEAAGRLRHPVARPLKDHFVTVACEREPGHVRWLVDGAVVQEATPDAVPPAAWAALEQAPLALEVSVDGRGGADERSALLLDSVGVWQREPAPAPAPVVEPVAARDPARAVAPAAALPAAAPPRRRPAGGAPLPAASAAASHRVVCEHSARYDLMLCY